MVVRRDERIARLALSSGNRAGRLKHGDERPQLIEALPLDAIDPDPDQPRRHFDAEKLQELANSIVAVGQLQPIIVVRAGERYRLHVGERRWHASRLAGLATIRAIVRSSPADARATRIAQIVENEQRTDLSTTELIDAVRKLKADGLKNIEIASALSKNPTRISELLALADAPPALATSIDRIGLGLAYQLLRKWRAQPEAVLDFLAHMPIEHISRVTIATIGQAAITPLGRSPTIADPRTSRSANPDTPLDERPLTGEGEAPRCSASSVQIGYRTQPGSLAFGSQPASPQLSDFGRLLVDHDEQSPRASAVRRPSTNGPSCGQLCRCGADRRAQGCDPHSADSASRSAQGLRWLSPVKDPRCTRDRPFRAPPAALPTFPRWKIGRQPPTAIRRSLSARWSLSNKKELR